MKKALGIIAAFAIVLGSQAHAAQYDIYVTNSEHISPSQAELSDLVQKPIYIDTEAKTVALPIQNAVLKVTDIQIENNNVVSVRAEGPLNLHGRPTQAIIQIDMNANNATSINFINSSDCKATRSLFVGSPFGIRK